MGVPLDTFKNEVCHGAKNWQREISCHLSWLGPELLELLAKGSSAASTAALHRRI
jgi:hypothetical protein